MRSISIRNARARLSELVDAAGSGESVLITRRGKPVARIVPASDASRPGPLPDRSEFRKSVKVKGKPLSQVVCDLRNEQRY